MTSDAELIGLRGSAETDAFSTLVERHGATVYRYAHSLIGNQDDAQDLVQDAFMTAWRKRRTVRVVDGSVLPWLLTTTRHHAANLMRKHQRRGDVPLLDIDVVDRARNPLERLVDREHLQWIDATLSGLSPEMQQVVTACLIDERPYTDVATELGLEVEAVKKRVSRARARLRAERERGEEGVRA